MKGIEEIMAVVESYTPAEWEYVREVLESAVRFLVVDSWEIKKDRSELRPR